MKLGGNFFTNCTKVGHSTWWMAVKFDDVFCSDPSTGLQFSVTQTSQQCSTTGWIMVTSPQSNCFYEKGLQKPSFFYSMTNTAVNWGSGNVLSCGILHVKGREYRIQLSAVWFYENAHSGKSAQNWMRLPFNILEEGHWSMIVMYHFQYHCFLI